MYISVLHHQGFTGVDRSSTTLPPSQPLLSAFAILQARSRLSRSERFTHHPRIRRPHLRPRLSLARAPSSSCLLAGIGCSSSRGRIDARSRLCAARSFGLRLSRISLKDFEGEPTFPGPDVATTATKRQLMGFEGDDPRRRALVSLRGKKKNLLGRSGESGEEVAGNEEARRSSPGCRRMERSRSRRWIGGDG